MDREKLVKLADHWRFDGTVLTLRHMASFLDALLATPAPSRSPSRAGADPDCRGCGGTGLEDKDTPCPHCFPQPAVGATPAPEPAAAPAVGERPGFDAAHTRWHDQHPRARGESHTAFIAGWQAALSTPAPAAGLVTAEMVEAACEARHGPEYWAWMRVHQEDLVAGDRRSMRIAIGSANTSAGRLSREAVERVARDTRAAWVKARQGDDAPADATSIWSAVAAAAIAALGLELAPDAATARGGDGEEAGDADPA